MATPQQQRPRRSILKKEDSNSSQQLLLDKQQHSVGWSDITVLEFKSILGDNPSCSEGAPLTLSWKLKRQESFQLDHYEYMRRPSSSLPRSNAKAKFRLDSGTRGSYLLNSGACTLKQLLKVVDEMDQIKESRRHNMKGRLEGFKNVFLRVNAKSAVVKPRVVASKSA